LQASSARPVGVNVPSDATIISSGGRADPHIQVPGSYSRAISVQSSVTSLPEAGANSCVA